MAYISGCLTNLCSVWCIIQSALCESLTAVSIIQNVEIKRSYETMYAEYLKTEAEVIHDEVGPTLDAVSCD